MQTLSKSFLIHKDIGAKGGDLVGSYLGGVHVVKRGGVGIISLCKDAFLSFSWGFRNAFGEAIRNTKGKKKKK